MASAQTAIPSAPIRRRYADAYRAARIIGRFGNTIKAVSLVLGTLIFLVGLLASASSAGLSVLGGIVAAIVIGGGGFVLGTFISAISQLQQATVDTAVNTCSFLSQEERLQIILGE